MSYEQARQAYSQGAVDLNSNSAAYRTDLDNIKASNKQLQSAAYTKSDLDTLKNVGQEIGVNQGRKMLGKVAGQVYDLDLRQVVSKGAGRTLDRLGVRTLREADKKASSLISDGVGQAKQYLSDLASPPVKPMLTPDQSYAESTFKGHGSIAPKENPATENIEMNEMGQGKNKTSTGETKDGDLGGETKTGEGALDNGVNDAKSVASDALDDGANAAKSVVGDALEASGTALDATGLGAVLGIPLQIAGAAVELGSVYEAGKSIVDFVEQDILHTAPPPKANLQKLPAFNSMNNRATIIPNFDTQMDLPSTSAGW